MSDASEPKPALRSKQDSELRPKLKKKLKKKLKLKPDSKSEPKPKKKRKKRQRVTVRRLARDDHELVVIGWRALIDFPEFGLVGIPAKVDTGARTSSLHATHVQKFERDGQAWLRFQLYSGKRRARIQTTAEARMVGMRKIRSSNGAVEERYVIETTLEARGQSWTAELTLAKRSSMTFPMLLGRACLRNRFFVDSGHSYLKTKTPPPAEPADEGEWSPS
jgi:hypothetical protein